MISKITKGSGTYWLVRYTLTEGQAGENGLHSPHANARVIGSWDGITSGKQDVKTLSRRLDAPVRFAGLEGDKHPTVWHLSLTNPPDDKVLTDQQWNEIAQEALDRTGIAKKGDTNSCRWYAVRHADNHVHVMATLVRPNGRRAWLRNDFRAVREVCREAELRYGLTRTAAADSTAAVRPGRAEQEVAARKNWEQPARVWLRQHVRQAAGSSLSIGDFFENLTRQGVMIKQRDSVKSPGEITGCAFASPNHLGADGQPIFYSGGKLSPDLTLPKLLARWASPSDGHPRTCPRFEGKKATSEVPHSSAKDRGQTWSALTDQMEAVTEKLAKRSSIIEADAAWTIGDLATVLAKNMEGNRTSGPYHRMAELVERAALHPNRAIPERTELGHNMRVASALLAGLQVTRRGETQQLLALLAQLELLVESVAKMREANDQAVQAQAARAAAEELRDKIAALAPPVNTVAGQQWWQAYEAAQADSDAGKQHEKHTHSRR